MWVTDGLVGELPRAMVQDQRCDGSMGGRVRFYSYIARSFPYGPDDGTLAPWAVAASLPFAPEVVLPSLHRLNEEYPEITNQYGFKCSYNPTFTSGNGKGWVSKGYFGLDQGPIIMMIENYRTGLIWRLMRRFALHRQRPPPRRLPRQVGSQKAHRRTQKAQNISNHFVLLFVPFVD